MAMVVVVKIGGNALKGGLHPTFFEDARKLADERGLVVIHGGAKEVTEVATKLGKQQVFVTSPQGFRSRYTDLETIQIYMMVMAGRVNKELVAALQQHGLNAVGLSGLDGALLKATRKKRLVIIDERGRKRIIDGGYTGTIKEVNTELLTRLIELGYTPVVAPVAIGEEYEFLNVDGDRVAARVAAALGADKLVILTDVEGVYIDDALVKNLTASEARRLLKKLGAGMITKVYASIEALEGGAKRVVISSGLIEHPLLRAVDETVGTVVIGG